MQIVKESYLKSHDVFLLPENKSEAAVVTTNGVIRNNGYAVMGRGVALSARNNFPGIDRLLGQCIREGGNHAYNLGVYSWNHTEMTVLSMPTKNDWRDPSDIELIKQSCHELMAIADRDRLTKIYMPRPGCQNGHLSWTDVEEQIKDILDDRFIVVIPE